MQSLTSEEIWELVDSKPGWAALTTIEPDGFPHTVAIGYFRLGETLYCGCRAGTRKCRNLEGNPKAALMLDGEPLRGVVFQGNARVIEGAAELLEIKRRLAEKRGQTPPTEVPAGIAYIELRPERIRSWKR
jgi:nitroimidazol reductase NimA-like FMN-containing flavoprotein (pyridoxamine 5'-phosphate oxidase superfamily)